MQDIWWLEMLGFLLTAAGAWRLLWRGTLILGLVGANKAGTAKGEQVEENKKNIKAMKAGLPLALGVLVVGIILIVLF